MHAPYSQARQGYGFVGIIVAPRHPRPLFEAREHKSLAYAYVYVVISPCSANVLWVEVSRSDIRVLDGLAVCQGLPGYSLSLSIWVSLRNSSVRTIVA